MKPIKRSLDVEDAQQAYDNSVWNECCDVWEAWLQERNSPSESKWNIVEDGSGNGNWQLMCDMCGLRLVNNSGFTVFESIAPAICPCCNRTMK